MTMTDTTNELQASDPQDILKEAESAVERLGQARAELAKVILGQELVVEKTLVTILAGGHGLLVGVPGLAKTLLVDTLGAVLGLDAGRIQFTPDLMPSDILGTEVLDQAPDGTRSFRFVKGPVFAQLLMADEINRASPRTQSALLQAMQEHHVTIAGNAYDLPVPFHVLATQNPLEQEGTYPLPEAQLDRFLLQIDVDYPDRETERRIALETTSTAKNQAGGILNADEVMGLKMLVRKMPVGDKVVDGILALVRSARPEANVADISEHIAWGPGPRASQALMLTVRARALVQGRLAPSMDDVAALAEPVLKHRMATTFAARAEGRTVTDLIDELVKRLKAGALE